MLRAAGFAMVCAAASVSAAPLPRDAARANYFPLTPGAVWTFHSPADKTLPAFRIEVTESTQKDGRQVATLVYHFDSGNITETMAADAKGVYRPAADGSFDKPVVVLQYPLTVGATWPSQLPLGSTRPDATATVKEVVDVQVTAGKYKAVVVEFLSRGDGPKLKLTAWYAPGVGVVKQVTEMENSTTTLELKAFRAAK